MNAPPRNSRRGEPTASALGPGQLAQIACLLEVNAVKPGNVHRFADLSG
jgi:hypothetical protein